MNEREKIEVISGERVRVDADNKYSLASEIRMMKNKGVNKVVISRKGFEELKEVYMEKLNKDIPEGEFNIDNIFFKIVAAIFHNVDIAIDE